MTIPTGEHSAEMRERLIDIVNEIILSNDLTVEEMAESICHEMKFSMEYRQKMALESIRDKGGFDERPTKKIFVSYERCDTKQYHEFYFSDWSAALEFAKLADRSDDAKLLSVEVAAA